VSAFKWLAAIGAALTMAACASKPDHFYTLDVLPAGDRPALASPLLHVRLDVTVPSLVDRSEMVMSTANNGVQILDHERWAAPLSDQVAQTLSRDIERRRSDILVGDRRFDQGKAAAVVKVDIVRMSVARAGHAKLEAHWHITDLDVGLDTVGGESFDVPLSGSDYAAVAQAYSQALSQLADRLVAALPAHGG
jgi:uncharacterized lipoprotein YmbA